MSVAHREVLARSVTVSAMTSPARTPSNLVDSTPGPFITPKGDPFKLMMNGVDDASPTSEGQGRVSKNSSGELQDGEQPPWWTLMTPDPTPMAWNHSSQLTSAAIAGTAASGAVQVRLPLTESPKASGIGSRPDDNRKAPAISKELIWEMCTPFFEQMVDAVQSAVQTRLQATSERAVTPSTEATAGSSSGSSCEGGGSAEGAAATFRPPTQEVLKDQIREALGKCFEKNSQDQRQRSVSWADASEAVGRRPVMRKLRSADLKLANEPIQEEASNALSPDCASASPKPTDTTKEQSQRQSSPSLTVPTAPHDQSRGKSPAKRSTSDRAAKTPAGAAAKPAGAEKVEVVCCHWRNKGWCKYLNQGGCKFAHPDHKRGVGQLDKASKRFGMAFEAPHAMMQKDATWPAFAMPGGWPTLAMNSRALIQQQCSAVQPLGMPTLSPYSPDAFMVTTVMV